MKYFIEILGSVEKTNKTIWSQEILGYVGLDPAYAHVELSLALPFRSRAAAEKYAANNLPGRSAVTAFPSVIGKTKKK